MKNKNTNEKPTIQSFWKGCKEDDTKEKMVKKAETGEEPFNPFAKTQQSMLVQG